MGGEQDLDPRPRPELVPAAETEADLDEKPGELEPEPEQEPGPDSELGLEKSEQDPEQDPGSDFTTHKHAEEDAETSKRAAAENPEHQDPPERSAPQALVNNSGLYDREISLRAEKLARIDAQRKQQQQSEMKDATFSPRINPSLPNVGSGSPPRTSKAAEIKMEETASRVANGFWPVTPVADRQRAPADIRPVVPRTGSGRVESSGAGEAAAPRLTRGKAAAVAPRRDPMEFAKKLQEKKLRAEKLRAEHKGR
jgi:hypothetical protein